LCKSPEFEPPFVERLVVYDTQVTAKLPKSIKRPRTGERSTRGRGQLSCINDERSVPDRGAVTVSDADRWNDRYSNAVPPDSIRPPEIVASHLAALHPGARVLDVACGWGDAGLFLAARGATVTLVDVSSEVIATVQARAVETGRRVETLVTDLTSEPVPNGPWDAITCVHYLDRGLLPRLGGTLSKGGLLVVAVATTTNLERHARPSTRFLLELDELPTLVPDLKIVHHSESWRANGSHEAWLVASTASPPWVHG
jgi:tellurite methyltransferase